MLIDDVSNAVELAYEARPERLYVIDSASKKVRPPAVLVDKR